MKNLYALLLVGFCFFAGHAQIVTIPDPVFKAKLLELGVDTDSDGEIEQSEALAVTSFDLYHCTFNSVTGIEAFANLEHLNLGDYCSIATAVDLTGLTHLTYLNITKSGMPSVNLFGLTALETLSVGYASITFLNFESATNLRAIYYYNSSINAALDLSHFPNLVNFSAQNASGVYALNLSGLTHLQNLTLKGYNNTIANLDVSDLVQLKHFNVPSTSITTLAFPNSPLLEDISVYNSGLTSLDVSNLPLLIHLQCGGNQLTSIDVSHNPNLESLVCNDNHLPAIDLSNLHKLDYVDMSGNLFTTLDFSSFTDAAGDAPQYYVQNNPNLISVNLKNGKHDYINTSQPFDCPNLIYLCLDDQDVADQTFILEQTWITDIQINTYCDFVPGGSYNTITGIVSLHPDGCTNAIAYAMQNIKVNLNDGTNTTATFTDSNGRYSFYTQAGNFTITPEITNALLASDPQNSNVSFIDNDNHMEIQDFCISAVSNLENLEIHLIPVVGARPGFDAKYELKYRNTGNQVMSGAVSFAYDEAVLDFVHASTTPDSQATVNLSWNYTNLLPFETRTIAVILNANSPMETPAVNAGDVLHFVATISPGTNTGNQANLDQLVVGSLDPNEKICLERTTMTPEKVGDYLNYVIRFQNSGTAPAENIVVKDVLDSEKFDISSIALVSSSHPHATQISGNKIEFIFEGINLPTDSSDEAASHGYVAFKVKTKPNLVLGNEVSNIADIYFDYNFPITTEPATTTVSLLARRNFEDKNISVYPNPVKNKLQINATDKITAVQLFDLQGRLIRTSTGSGLNMAFDMSGNATGVYLVKIDTSKGVKTEKIIKE